MNGHEVAGPAIGFRRIGSPARRALAFVPAFPLAISGIREARPPLGGRERLAGGESAETLA